MCIRDRDGSSKAIWYPMCCCCDPFFFVLSGIIVLHFHEYPNSLDYSPITYIRKYRASQTTFPRVLHTSTPPRAHISTPGLSTAGSAQTNKQKHGTMLLLRLVSTTTSRSLQSPWFPYFVLPLFSRESAGNAFPGCGRACYLAC